MLMDNLMHTVQCIFRKENLIVGLTGEFHFKDLLNERMTLMPADLLDIWSTAV